MGKILLRTLFQLVGDAMRGDETETLKWLRRGADQGNIDSQFNLGIAYLLGEGIEKNVVESYLWLELSAFGGHEEASEFLEALTKKMTPADIAAAQGRARDWTAGRGLKARKRS